MDDKAGMPVYSNDEWRAMRDERMRDPDALDAALRWLCAACACAAGVLLAALLAVNVARALS